ncbi:hypothetical protein [Frisingicoccus sp.]|mgnify:CR=1 FL=1|uniref:hypothetical protein n=1 Tax=Frisingicoccus sp. TaxID=1918627 RepID=UPI003AB4B235
MKAIYFKHVQAAREGLLEQVSMLRSIQGELLETEQKIKYMSFTEQTVLYLKSGIQELEEEISALQSMADCLERVMQICLKTEQRICDCYNMERLVYPRTTFARSSLSGLEGCKTLFEFQIKKE